MLPMSSAACVHQLDLGYIFRCSPCMCITSAPYHSWMRVQPCIKASIIKFLPGSLLCLAPHRCLTYSHLLSFSLLCLNPSYLKWTNFRSKPRFCLFFPPFLQAVFSVEAEANQRLEISLQRIQFCGTSWNNDTKRLYEETSNVCAGRDNEQMIPQLLVCSSPPVREHVFWANYALCKQSFTYLNIKKTKPNHPSSA